MYKSDEKYTNRYGDEYKFTKVSPNGYLFEMTGSSMEYCRFGGREGQQGLNWDDLGMFDPSGGPYVALGTKIDGKEIVKISSFEDTFVVEVK